MGLTLFILIFVKDPSVILSTNFHSKRIHCRPTYICYFVNVAQGLLNSYNHNSFLKHLLPTHARRREVKFNSVKLFSNTALEYLGFKCAQCHTGILSSSERTPPSLDRTDHLRTSPSQHLLQL